jgi:hypothetical protein
MAETYSMRVREDGIVVFRLPKQSRDVIDRWIEDLSRLGAAWIEGELVLLLIDMRGVGVATPYNADSLQKVSRSTSATQNIHTAFIFDGGAAMALSNRLLDGLGPLLGEKRPFTAEDEALKWLSKRL